MEPTGLSLISLFIRIAIHIRPPYFMCEQTNVFCYPDLDARYDLSCHCLHISFAKDFKKVLQGNLVKLHISAD